MIDKLRNKNWSSIKRNVAARNYGLLLGGIYSHFFSPRWHDGVHVMKEDWDYLIILDACRYDAFKEVNWLPGTLERRTSLGSCSPEFMKRNFTEYYHDTVYVSGNPFISKFVDKNTSKVDGSEFFHHVEQVFLDDDAHEKGTTRPEAVTAAAIEQHKEYPDKRMILHYMQPHLPFIGKYQLLEERPEGGTHYYKKILKNGHTWKDIRKAYNDNLKRALKSVEELIEQLEGRFVLTADHGEALGAYGLSSHYCQVYIKELVEVPWHIIEHGERPQRRKNLAETIDV